MTKPKYKKGDVLICKNDDYFWVDKNRRLKNCGIIKPNTRVAKYHIRFLNDKSETTRHIDWVETIYTLDPTYVDKRIVKLLKQGRNK